VGLPPENNMLLEQKLSSSIEALRKEREAAADNGPAKKRAKR
jgi:hypothetical protein